MTDVTPMTRREAEQQIAGLRADLAEERRKFACAEQQIVGLEREVERLTHENARINEHRARLIAEKDIAWGVVLAPDGPKAAPSEPMNHLTTTEEGGE